MQYISIDIETTGLNPIEHDIIEFAAIIDEIGSNKPIEKLPKFHRYIKKDSSYICDAKAIAMHPKIFEKLAEKDESCVFIEDLMYAFGNFLQNNEDGWTEEMEQRYWDEQVPEPFATPEEVEKFNIDVQVLDNTSSSDDEKKK